MRKIKTLIIALALSIVGTSISLPTNTTETFAATKTVKLNRKSLTLKEGQLYRLELLNKKARAWKTTNKKVATVVWGLVQGKGAGTCYIKVYPVKSSKVYKCKVTVTSKNGKSSTTETKKPETKPTETKTPINTNTVHFKEENNMYFGSSIKLHLLDENGNDISDQAYWTSDKYSIVSKDGYVHKYYSSNNLWYTPTVITATYKNKDYTITLRHADKYDVEDYDFEYYMSHKDQFKFEFINNSYYWDTYTLGPAGHDYDVIETSDGNKYGAAGSKMYEDGELVTRSAFKYLTEQEFAKILEQIKTQYPAGTYWGFDTEYTPKFGGVPINACAGFVDMITDTAVGKTYDYRSSGGCFEGHKISSPSELKLYDIVEYKNHVAIITGFTENGILVCEGNHGSRVCWDCETTYDELFDWNNVYAGSFINH